ncbi:hypothetical protein T484DRAFT_2613208 [Baffinella frigidus]|nr:hypothetical protein T484DRAFT_2613208 [Cryptophyta sp. CCMP2293]
MWNQKNETRNLRFETRNPEPETRNSKPGSTGGCETPRRLPVKPSKANAKVFGFPEAPTYTDRPSSSAASITSTLRPKTTSTKASSLTPSMAALAASAQRRSPPVAPFEASEAGLSVETLPGSWRCWFVAGAAAHGASWGCSRARSRSAGLSRAPRNRRYIVGRCVSCFASNPCTSDPKP